MDIPQLIFQIAILYAPAMAANMAPVFVARYNLIPWLNKPMDFGLRMSGIRILGDNKTVRGFVFGMIAGACTGALESFIVSAAPFSSLQLAVAFGAWTGLGALAGDSVKSFFKRRRKIPSGTSWMVFDQIDFVVGATVFGLFFIRIPVVVALFAIASVGFASYIVSVIGVALRIKEKV